MRTNQALEHFKRCADEAPDGTYEQAKEVNEVIGNACKNLAAEIRALGLKADNCDLIYVVETAMYDYVKNSNPDATVFPTAEGFGSSMDGAARDRVLAQTKSDRDFLRSTANTFNCH